MQITVLGTPAEEGQGGKINLIEAGVFDDGDLRQVGSFLRFPPPIKLTATI
jgi:metal-dependent amidase/aminoacylase/carboxypeptidase family protein